MEFNHAKSNRFSADEAFRYVKEHGIDTEKAYPYVAKDKTCKYTKQKSNITISGFKDIPTGDEQKLQQALVIRKKIEKIAKIFNLFVIFRQRWGPWLLPLMLPCPHFNTTPLEFIMIAIAVPFTITRFWRLDLVLKKMDTSIILSRIGKIHFKMKEILLIYFGNFSNVIVM